MCYTQVFAGNAHSVLLRSDGSAVACGSNSTGQCNIPPPTAGCCYVFDSCKDYILQVGITFKNDAAVLTCCDLAGHEVLRIRANESDLVWDTQKRIARDLQVNLQNLRWVLPCWPRSAGHFLWPAWGIWVELSGLNREEAVSHEIDRIHPFGGSLWNKQRETPARPNGYRVVSSRLVWPFRPFQGVGTPGSPIPVNTHPNQLDTYVQVEVSTISIRSQTEDFDSLHTSDLFPKSHGSWGFPKGAID